MSQSSEEGQPVAPLEWSVRPFKESAVRSAIVIVVILAVGFLIFVAFKEPYLAVLSVLLLFASLHTYFGRTTYRLDADQVTVKSSFGTIAKRWSHFKKYYVDRKGVTLSPFDRPSRLEPFRSTRLLYGSNKDEVLAFISKRFNRNPGDGPR